MRNDATTGQPSRSVHTDTHVGTMRQTDNRMAASHANRRMAYSVAFFAVLVGLWSVTTTSQSVIPAPVFTAYDDNGDPCAGCLLYAYLSGTTTPTDTYTSSTLGTPNAHPVVLNAAGRAAIFVDDTINYKFVLKTAAGVDIWTGDGILGQLAGVVLVTAADTEGLQISRAGADAGLSIESSGGSGKAWCFNSTTSGTLLIQDCSDGTPRFQLGSGNDANVTLTGSFLVSGGLLGATGHGLHTITSAGTGGNTWRVRNTTAGTGNYAEVQLGNDADADGVVQQYFSSTFTPSGSALANGYRLQVATAGGMSFDANHASGDIRFYAGGSTTPAMTIADTGTVTINRFVTTSANPNSGTTHDFALTGSVILYNSGIGAATVTGLTGGVNGRQLWVMTSPASSGNITLAHENAGSTAANRITSATGADIEVTATEAVQCVYDDGSSRWLCYDVK